MGMQKQKRIHIGYKFNMYKQLGWKYNINTTLLDFRSFKKQSFENDSN